MHIMILCHCHSHRLKLTFHLFSISCSSSWTLWQSSSAGEKLFAAFIKSAATLLLHSRPAIRRFSPWSMQASTTAIHKHKHTVQFYSSFRFLQVESFYLPLSFVFLSYIAQYNFLFVKASSLNIYNRWKASAGGTSRTRLKSARHCLPLLGYEGCESHTPHSWLVSTPLKGVSLL